MNEKIDFMNDEEISPTSTELATPNNCFYKRR